MMGQYDNHIVNGAALTQVLTDVHGDQQRQDDIAAGIADSIPTALEETEIANIWNNH